jgi:hypothetical protein
VRTTPPLSVNGMVRIAVAAVLAAAADAVLFAHHLPIPVPIWLPHGLFMT